jgi:hypothetical protein
VLQGACPFTMASRALRSGKNLGYAFGHTGGAIHPFFDLLSVLRHALNPVIRRSTIQCEPDVRFRITHNDLDARTQMSLRSPAQAGY